MWTKQQLLSSRVMMHLIKLISRLTSSNSSLSLPSLSPQAFKEMVTFIAHEFSYITVYVALKYDNLIHSLQLYSFVTERQICQFTFLSISLLEMFGKNTSLSSHRFWLFSPCSSFLLFASSVWCLKRIMSTLLFSSQINCTVHHSLYSWCQDI